MSNGAGHIIDMINRMKQNRSQLSSKRSKFKANNREGIYSSTKKQQPKFKTLSEEELNERKKEILKQAKKERKKELLSVGILTFCVLIFILLVAIWLSNL